MPDATQAVSPPPSADVISGATAGELALVRAWALHQPPGDLVFSWPDGRRLWLSVPTPTAAILPPPIPPVPPVPTLPPRRHSDDFRTVVWDGRQFDLTPMRAAVVRVLWEAMERGTPALGQAAILEAVDSTCKRLFDLFRGHPAWGTLIVRAERGSFRLAP